MQIFSDARFAGVNFTAGVREREDVNRTRETGDALWESAVRESVTLLREGVNAVNGARGTRDIEGKVTRVGASEHGLRTSFKIEYGKPPFRNRQDRALILMCRSPEDRSIWAGRRKLRAHP